MKHLKLLNETLKPGYKKSELMSLLKPIMNQVYEATFTEEAKSEGIEDKDEQTIAHILTHIFDWDYNAITKVYAYALEDSNYRKEATEAGKKVGLDL